MSFTFRSHEIVIARSRQPEAATDAVAAAPAGPSDTEQSLDQFRQEFSANLRQFAQVHSLVFQRGVGNEERMREADRLRTAMIQAARVHIEQAANRQELARSVGEILVQINGDEAPSSSYLLLSDLGIDHQEAFPTASDTNGDLPIMSPPANSADI